MGPVDVVPSVDTVEEEVAVFKKYIFCDGSSLIRVPHHAVASVQKKKNLLLPDWRAGVNFFLEREQYLKHFFVRKEVSSNYSFQSKK